MSRGELSAAVPGRQPRTIAGSRAPALTQPACSGVLIVPPFAEEMNKSRHLFTEVADGARRVGRRHRRGRSVRHRRQRRRIRRCRLERLEVGSRCSRAVGSQLQQITITKLLAVRLGCALGCEAAREHGWKLERTVLWQPVVSGTRALDQFLRLRVAATMMQKDGKETMAGLARAVEVGRIGRGRGLRRDRTHRRANWIASISARRWARISARSVGSRSSVPPMHRRPPAAKLPSNEREPRGANVELHALLGEPFWSSVEIVRNPTLVRRYRESARSGRMTEWSEDTARLRVRRRAAARQSAHAQQAQALACWS